jgi:signal peptidase I
MKQTHFLFFTNFYHRHRKALFVTTGIITVVIIIPISFLLLYYDNVQFAIVYGDSMYPALLQGDAVITIKDDSKPDYSFDGLKNGDIIMYHTYAFDPTWAPNVNVIHRVNGSYIYPDTGERVLITKGDNNQDTHALIDYPICEQYYEGKVVARIPFVAIPRVYWGQSYEQLLDDEQLPHWNQQQVILERSAGCTYYDENNPVRPILKE